MQKPTQKPMQKPMQKHWSAEAIETALAAQGIALAPGRAERVARAQQALLEAAAADPLRAALAFDANPAGYRSALDRCR
jgi:hypothetical protein